MNIKRISVVAFLFFVIITTFCYGEMFSTTDGGFALDFPEGFQVVESNQTDSFYFKHSQLPVDVVLRIYPLERYQSVPSALDQVYKQLSADGSYQVVDWRNTECRLGTFKFGSDNNAFEGWSAGVKLPLEQGILVLLVYTEEKYANQLAQFEVSIVDSLCIDRGSFYEPGIVTTYAFLPEGDLPVSVNIAGKKIDTAIDKIDEEAAKFVIEREFAVLTLYVNSEKRDAAWQRYYRMIYRDSYKRFKRAAFAIYNELWPLAQEKQPDNPDFALAQMLLQWTQKFEYVRDKKTSDFSPLPTVFQNAGSDCDSRAMLLAVLMSHMNYKTMVFISPEFQHAFFGIAIKGQGAHLTVENTSYLLGETTASVALGLVPQDMSEISKWMHVLNVE